MRYLRSLLFVPLLAAFAIAMTPFGSGVTPDDADATATVEAVTIQGHLIDTKCYGMGVNMDKPKMNYHNTHMVPKKGEMVKMPNCATACANMGIPVGIVEGSKPGNKTYLLVTPSNQLADHMDKEARVEGNLVFDGGLIPSSIEVKEGGEWKKVEVATMM